MTRQNNTDAAGSVIKYANRFRELCLHFLICVLPCRLAKEHEEGHKNMPLPQVCVGPLGRQALVAGLFPLRHDPLPFLLCEVQCRVEIRIFKNHSLHLGTQNIHSLEET